jgi:hypothetical protein
MSIFIPKKYQDMVLDCRKDLLEKTDIHIIELEEIRDRYFSEYWNTLQKIRTDPVWINSTEWLSRVPQAFSEWYNPIVMSKVFFVNESYEKDTFKSDVYIWIDAGITQHIPKEFVCNNSISNMGKLVERVLFTSFEYKNASELHGFSYEGFKKYTKVVPEHLCRATIFGCNRNYVTVFNEEYKYYLKDTLERGYLGTEESIFTLLSIVNPDIYHTHNMGFEVTSMPITFLRNLTI